jgi:MscS family membrane protein
MAKVCVVFVSVLFIGQNILGLNITTLLAGAGVAGLAIAFAAQDSIANFFGSLMIILDRPFSVGDYVRIDSFEGTIERVGLRSSALRTKDGHLITIPNKQAANSSIVNISARPYIRNVVNLGLVYDTPPEKMEEAMKILQRLLHRHEGFDEMHPAKINFTEFKDFSLNIEVVIWYHPGDYFQCREWMSKFNMEVLRSFNEAGLEFAFPTSTNYLASDSKRGLKVIQDVEQGG